MGLEEVQQLGQAAGREAVVAADALMEFASIFRDLERLLEAARPAQAMPADLQEDLVQRRVRVILAGGGEVGAVAVKAGT